MSQKLPIMSLSLDHFLILTQVKKTFLLFQLKSTSYSPILTHFICTLPHLGNILTNANLPTLRTNKILKYLDYQPIQITWTLPKQTSLLKVSTSLPSHSHTQI